MDDEVAALVTMPNGNIIASGYFFDAGGASVECIAEWDGSSWSDLSPAIDFDDAPICLVALPNNPAIVGAVVFQQVVPFALSGSGVITAVTGTNALALTVGGY